MNQFLFEWKEQDQKPAVQSLGRDSNETSLGAAQCGKGSFGPFSLFGQEDLPFLILRSIDSMF
jgi:hypothetical protein